MNEDLRQMKMALWFILPSAILLILIVGYPFFYNLYISMTNWNMYHFRDPDFTGLHNYRLMLKDFFHWTTGGPLQILLKTFAWTIVNLIFHFVLGLGAAMLLNQRLPARGLYRALLILPWAMPQYISALTWRGMFNSEFGAINLMLAKVGITGIPWMTDQFWALAAPTLVNIWLGFPFIMVVTLGGLQSIPQELYEAARIDGAGAVRRFFSITLPLLRPVLLPALVLGTIWTFNNLNVIWLVTDQGRPEDSTHILVTFVYKAAFLQYRYGYAAAFSVLIFLILFFIVRGYRKVGEQEAL